MMNRIGVFICHCGRNIAATVDVKSLVQEISKYPGVIHCEDYKYMCSDPGQNLIKEKIKEKNIEAVVIAACTPSLHSTTFRRAIGHVGLNPFLLEIANIREQCSWIHKDITDGTKKAGAIIRAGIEKVRLNESLMPSKFPVTKRAMVIGAGIAGIQASLDIANSGYEVVLVEKSPSIGGHMAQLSETFPTLDCSQCILTPKMVEAGHHKKIRLYTYSEIEEVSGTVGNFKVKIRKKSPSIHYDKCNGCADCVEVCPITLENEFDLGLSARKAIYRPFPQAIPNKFTIDRRSCVQCGLCIKVCEQGAIDYELRDEIIETEVGAIIIATGYELYPTEKFSEYGGGKYKDVVNGLQFERLLSASGPTQGEVRRPSDNKIPKRVAFISCVGSRDPEHHLPYCSKICCMYLLKHALLYKERVPDGEPIIFTIDIRTAGKGYEEFFIRAKENEHITYIRGKPGRIIKDGDGLVIWAEDMITQKPIKVHCDMAVLATAITPSAEVTELARRLNIHTDTAGFFSEAHPKLRPVESLVPGFFLAGCAQAPKDIPDTVAQASAAASKVLEMFSRGELQVEPFIASVDEELCAGCRLCVVSCPYDARVYDKEKGVVRVQESLCLGCGACIAACPSGATQQKNLNDQQLSRMVEVIIGC